MGRDPDQPVFRALPGGEACWGQGQGLHAPAPPSRTPGSELQTPEPPAVPQDWAALGSTRAHFLPTPRGGEGHPRAGVHPALLCSPLSEEATEGWLHDAQRPTRRPSWAGGTILLNAEPPLRLPQKGGCRCPPHFPRLVHKLRALLASSGQGGLDRAREWSPGNALGVDAPCPGGHCGQLAMARSAQVPSGGPRGQGRWLRVEVTVPAHCG